MRRDLQVLGAVAAAAVEAADEESLLARTTAVLREALGLDLCGFLMLDEGRGLLHRTLSSHDERQDEARTPVPVGSGVVGEVAATGEPRRVDDAESEPDSAAFETGMRSGVWVPVKMGPRVLGVLAAGSRRRAAFDDNDEQLLSLVASQVAIAAERLRTAGALDRSRELYRAYFTASPLAVFVADTKGRYQEVNGATAALTGYSREELLRMSISDLLVTEGATELRDRFTGLMAHGIERREVRICRKDGQLRYCLVHAATVGFDHLLGFLLDITDRREAEERLRESEERFRGLSEASVEAILIHDQGRVVDVNHALCELGGYAWHELIGRDVFDLIAPEDRERVYRLLLDEHEGPYEITGLRRDGSPVPVEVRARSFFFRGQVLRVAALRDISERKRAEAVRESLIRKLEAKNAELERFTHVVSRDLKSPLITMRGFVEYLLADTREGRADRLAEDAARVAEAAGKMQSLLDHLVELSRGGRLPEPPARGAENQTVTEAAVRPSG